MLLPCSRLRARPRCCNRDVTLPSVWLTSFSQRSEQELTGRHPAGPNMGSEGKQLSERGFLLSVTGRLFGSITYNDARWTVICLSLFFFFLRQRDYSHIIVQDTPFASTFYRRTLLLKMYRLCFNWLLHQWLVRCAGKTSLWLPGWDKNITDLNKSSNATEWQNIKYQCCV